MRKWGIVRPIALTAILIFGSSWARAADEKVLKRGEYLVTIMDCTGCHTTGALTGAPDPKMFVAGSAVGWLIPNAGVFYPPNITPDEKTGIGSWSEMDIVEVLRTGTRPDGRLLIPVMPWPSYSKLTDEDVRAVAAYLKTVPAIAHEVPGPTPLDQVKSPYITVASPKK